MFLIGKCVIFHFKIITYHHDHHYSHTRAGRSVTEHPIQSNIALSISYGLCGKDSHLIIRTKITLPTNLHAACSRKLFNGLTLNDLTAHFCGQSTF